MKSVLRRRVVFVLAGALLAFLVVIIAMNFSSSTKRLEYGVSHRYAVTDAQFEREMGVLMGPSIVRGNQIDALQNGDEIFPAMLEAIRAAKQTITFETYIYWSGDIGSELADALSERAKAGVRVHVLVDWVGSIKMDDDLLERMETAGVELHKYRPLSWYHVSRVNNRTHRKLLVVDGRVAFTGGVGIADAWEGNAQDADHWRDVHFRIRGPVAAQVQAAFNDNWMKTTGRVLNGEAYFPELEPVGTSPAHLFLSSPAGGSESMHLMYLLAITAATERIDLCAAYFVPDKLITEALLEARKRGVAIRVLLPGEHIDSESVRAASRQSWGPLLEAGIEIHQFEPTMMHSKVLIIDGYLVSVGSTNFDPRSFRLNDEASLNVYDRDFAAVMTKSFEADLLRSRRYTLEDYRARSWSERMAEKIVVPIRSQL
ncbi:MAG: cardiolipin synthase B [Archangium gephyra]|uniref:Cardiolipin synthase B n=1 Tax=Archangium gephyra TaxID=48 RepID=A0A2W5THB8_9BACT|nr:MAG: cardiolipin synthase B [Archangium gephyra]